MIGIDIVKISRIDKLMKTSKFCERILNEPEIEYAFSKSKVETEYGFNSVAMTVAGLFASKEAVLKALGIGMRGGYSFKDITIGHNDKGAPIVLLSDKIAPVLKSLGKSNIFLSIAHDGEYAIASVVTE